MDRNIKNDIDVLTQKYRDKLNNKAGNEFSLTSTYNDKVVSILHNECKREFQLHPRYFLTKLACPLCEKEKKYDVRREKTKKIVAEFKKELKTLVGDEYKVTRDYMDPEERKVSLEHKCGHKYDIKINSFRNGRRCPICTKTQPKSPEEYAKEFKELAGNKFELLTKYERANKKVEVLCNQCNEKFPVNPSYFKRDLRCPLCEKKTIPKRTSEEE